MAERRLEPRQVERRRGCAGDLHLDVSLELKETLYRIAQQALHNTIKHARAKRIALRLQHLDGRLRLEVDDDGVGFDPTMPYPGHLGLRSMRERAARLDGRLEIQSAPNGGTHIRAEFPLDLTPSRAPLA